MKKLLPEFFGAAAAAAFFSIPGAAQAQSVPYTPITLGEVWTPAQWAAAWSSKQDVAAIPGGGGYVSVKTFGAVGDGSTDDTAAINNGEASLQPGQVLWFPPGVYRITSPLSVTRTRASWQGEGFGQTYILYDATPANVDILTIGGVSAVSQDFFDGITIQSKTKMTAGSAVHLKNVSRSVINLKIQGQDGVTSFGNQAWNGILFDNTNDVAWRSVGVFAQNDAIQLNNAVATFLQDGFLVSSAAIGLHIGGASSWAYVGAGEFTANTQSVVVDQALAASGNSQLMFNGTFFNTSSGGPHVYHADPGGGATMFTGCLIRSAATAGVLIASAQNGGQVQLEACRIMSNGTDGVRVDSTNCIVAIMGCLVSFSGNYGVNPGATNVVSVSGGFFSNNTNGDLRAGNDYYYYNHTSSQHRFGIAGADALFLSSNHLVMGMPSFGFDWSNVNLPILDFDANDYLSYDRANNLFQFAVGGTVNVTITNNSLGFDPNFFLGLFPNPTIQFDSGDGLAYDRTNNAAEFIIKGINEFQILSNASGGAQLWTSLNGFGFSWAASSDPYYAFDNGDLLGYSRSSNFFYFSIGATQQYFIFNGYTRQTPVAFASLPSAATAGAGARAFITNGAASPTYGSVVGTLGSSIQSVWSNGTNWLYG